jgi:hypothetical protein
LKISHLATLVLFPDAGFHVTFEVDVFWRWIKVENLFRTVNISERDKKQILVKAENYLHRLKFCDGVGSLNLQTCTSCQIFFSKYTKTGENMPVKYSKLP